MKLKDLLRENWDVKDGKVLSNGKLVGYYEYNRDSDSFWVDDVQKGKGQLSFDTKREVVDYFKKNERDALKHLGKLRESLLKEGQYDTTWSKNADKKGYTLKSGNIELKSGGEGGEHTIYKNGKKWGVFELDKKDRGWEVTEISYLSRSTFWVNDIDKLIDKVGMRMHTMTREKALDDLKHVIHNIEPYSREAVEHIEAAIKIIEKFEGR
jgi:hypothetical protein